LELLAYLNADVAPPLSRCQCRNFLQCRQPYFLFQHRHQLTPVISPLCVASSFCKICKTSLSQAFLSAFFYFWCLCNSFSCIRYMK